MRDDDAITLALIAWATVLTIISVSEISNASSAFEESNDALESVRAAAKSVANVELYVNTVLNRSADQLEETQRQSLSDVKKISSLLKTLEQSGGEAAPCPPPADEEGEEQNVEDAAKEEALEKVGMAGASDLPLEKFSELRQMESLLGRPIKLPNDAAVRKAQDFMRRNRGTVKKLQEFRHGGEAKITYLRGMLKSIQKSWPKWFETGCKPIYRDPFEEDAEVHESNEEGLAAYKKFISGRGKNV